jgi:hypothetical protein
MSCANMAAAPQQIIVGRSSSSSSSMQSGQHAAACAASTSASRRDVTTPSPRRLHDTSARHGRSSTYPRFAGCVNAQSAPRAARRAASACVSLCALQRPKQPQRRVRVSQRAVSACSSDSCLPALDVCRAWRDAPDAESAASRCPRSAHAPPSCDVVRAAAPHRRRAGARGRSRLRGASEPRRCSHAPPQHSASLCLHLHPDAAVPVGHGVAISMRTSALNAASAGAPRPRPLHGEHRCRLLMLRPALVSRH